MSRPFRPAGGRPPPSRARPGWPRRALFSRPCRPASATACLVPLLLVAALAGCGGDDEPSAETTRELPDLTAPVTDPVPTDTEPEETTPTTTTVDPATETLPEEGPTSPADEPPADTPENDSPPPAD